MCVAVSLHIDRKVPTPMQSRACSFNDIGFIKLFKSLNKVALNATWNVSKCNAVSFSVVGAGLFPYIFIMDGRWGSNVNVILMHIVVIIWWH